MATQRSIWRLLLIDRAMKATAKLTPTTATTQTPKTK